MSAYDLSPTQATPAGAPLHGLLPGVQPTRWQVTPADFDQCPLVDSVRHFAVQIVARSRRGKTYFSVSQDESTGWTKNGAQVWLRHDVNAKHARHAHFEDAQRLAFEIVNGHLEAEGYTHWRDVVDRRGAAS